jgi:predicted peptidase
MKSRFLLAPIFVFAITAWGLADVPAVRTLDEESQAQTKCLNPEYLVFAPRADDETKLPLLIYLHGAGGRGNEIRKVTGQAMAVWQGIATFEKGPCIVVAPQCLSTVSDGQHRTWTVEDLNLFLEHLKATLPVDEKRIYLTGNSMGGYGTWVWAARNPEHFAAVAPVSGGTGRGGPKDISPRINEWAKNLTKVPVYAFAGAKDRVVPPDRSESLVAAIEKAGGEQVKIKVYPDEGHNARRLVYTTAEFYDWVFSKTRD